MFRRLGRNWWLYALRGTLAVIFGLLALIWPARAMLALVLLFGVCVIVDGVFAVFAGIAAYGWFERWWAVLLGGIAGLAVGVIALLQPDMTERVLMVLIAAWALFTGLFEIVTAIRLRPVIRGEWELVLSGVLAVAVGGLLLAFPAIGAVSLVWLIGMCALVFGAGLLVVSFRLRRLWHDFEVVFEADW